jgi:hypothetical protein
MRSFFDITNRFRALVLSLLVFLIFGFSLYNTFASFTPGQTLDPNCAPLDPGCYVDISFSETDALVGAVNGIVKSDGSANFSAATAGVDYEVPLTFSTGLTRSTNTITVNTSQSITKLSNLTSNGFVKTSSGDGTLIVDTNTYLTSAMVSLNGLSGTTQTFSIGSSGTDFNIFSFGSVHTFNFPTASASARGLLSSSDWSAFNSKQGALTFSTGLTDTSSTITVNLSTGISGGQSVVGGTSASDNLTLSSTTDTTKGQIIFGNSFYSEDLNVLSLNTTNTDFRLNIDVGAGTPDGGIMAVGTLGQGVDLNIAGTGTRMFWYPKKAAFRAGYVGTDEWDNANIGDNSVAFGENKASGTSSAAFNSGNTASGQQSVAFGGSNISSGSNSAVFGLLSTSSGNSSVSFGRNNDVSGDFSASFGEEMTVSGDYSFGFNMDQSIPQTISGNKIFSILGGNVGIGTTSPVAPLTVGDSSIDGSIFAYGNIGSGAFSNGGTGAQMMWYPRKAAFRAGFEGGLQWDDAYIGNYSASFGTSGIASGTYSYSFGNQSNATGDTTFSFGSTNDASGDYSVVFGSNTTVSGDYSFGINLNSINQTISANNVMAIMGGKVGIDSVNPEFDLTLGDISDINADGGIMAIGTFGSGATLSTTGVGSRMFWYPRKAAFRAGYASVDEFNDINIGDFSIALGQGPLANNTGSIALGSQVYATGPDSIVIGSSSIAASQSVAIGHNANAFGRFSVSFGGSAPSYSSGYASFAFGDNSKTGYVPDNFSLNNPGDVILIIPGDASSRFQVNDIVNIYVNNPSIVPSVQRQVQNVFFNGVDTEITIDQNINGFSIGGLVSSQAFGVNAFAAGFNSQALGESSFVAGSGSLAEGVRSVALGDQAVASGYGSVALSGMNYATGQYSLAGGGNNSYATGTNAISLGSNNTASGANSLSLGTQMEVSGDNSVGINLFSSNSQNLSQNNTLAIMGGNVGIGNLTPSVPLSVVGDAEINGSLVIANLLTMPNIPAYDDDAAAGSGGLTTGQVYKTTGAGAPPLNVPGILMIKQ